jgi:hypothetical protein
MILSSTCATLYDLMGIDNFGEFDLKGEELLDCCLFGFPETLFSSIASSSHSAHGNKSLLSALAF